MVGVVLSGALVALTLLFAQASTAADEKAAQPDQINAFVDEMVTKHAFDKPALAMLLGAAQKQQRILDAIASPAEAKPWYQYRPIFVTESRIREGIEFWDANAATLARATDVYGVPASIIVAIIGVETRYGRHKGGFRVIDSLSTLAFNYPPRSSFFRSELEQFLLLTREENIDPLQPLGSYAGAMGRPQFISSSYRRYAIDFDGDGFRDLWQNDADAIGSVANYFAEHGWQRGEPIVERAEINGNEYQQVLSDSPATDRSVGELRAHGVTIATPLPDEMPATLLRLETRGDPEYWVGLKNYYVITRYNHSILYAMAVFQLSREIETRRHTKQAQKD